MTELWSISAHEAGHVIGNLCRNASIIWVKAGVHGGETRVEGSFAVGDRRRHELAQGISLAAGDAGSYLYAYEQGHPPAAEVTSAHDLTALKTLYEASAACRASYQAFPVFGKMMFRGALGALLTHRDYFQVLTRHLPSKTLVLPGDIMAWGGAAVSPWIAEGAQDWEPTLHRLTVQGHEFVEAQPRGV